MQKQTNKQIEISKTMSYALRHDPKAFNLTMDEYGNVNIDALLIGLQKQYHKLTKQDIIDIVKTCPKQRYTIEGNLIRAKGGHNKKLGIKIKKTSIKPPDILYHGTTTNATESILKTGLKGMQRQYADMSEDIETAIIVGKRREAQPTILKIDAKRAYEDGIEFYAESIKTYSVEYMPVKYISFYKKGE